MNTPGPFLRWTCPNRAPAGRNAVRPEVTITRLLKLVGAIALATEQDPDGAAEAELLLAIAIDGVRTR
ncbi:hypothetical protein ACFU6J_00580 [Streptomyces gardneri]|uniref:SbtR family transcriptional regulator n=1 Tax=Streptomyces gardneri TaxID=66892 RepID=UPI0036B5CB37